MSDNNSVQVIEPITGTALVTLEIFTPAGVEAILSSIKAKVAEHKPDLSTVTSRKAIASTAYKVSQSKTLLDDLGKSLNEQKRAEIGKVDTERKKLRDALDLLRDETRKPLDEWEAAETARIAAEKLAKDLADAHDAALAEHALFLRAKEIERKEAELARIEAERLAKEEEAAKIEAARIEAERAEVARKENEERIRKEAAEKADKEAKEAAAAQIAEAERKEREAQAAKEKAERDAKEAAERAERDRIAAEEKAKAEQAAAVAEAERKAKEEAERVERERKAKDAHDALIADNERKEAERKAADVEHRRTVNKEVLEGLWAAGLNEKQAKAVITAIVGGMINHVRINY